MMPEQRLFVLQKKESPASHRWAFFFLVNKIVAFCWFHLPNA